VRVHPMRKKHTEAKSIKSLLVNIVTSYIFVERI
jgi:hypothetical protein